MPDPAAALLTPEYMQSVAAMGRQAQTATLDAIQSEKFRRGIGRTALAALGIGAGARGLNGLYNVMRRNMSTPSRKTGPRMLAVPVVEDEKAASLGQAVGDFFQGRLAETAEGMPTFYPAQALAGIGALGLGWKATDALLDQRRRSDQQAELAAAREDYEKALRKQGSAEASELGRDLDELFEKCCELVAIKEAGVLGAAKELAGRVATPVLGVLAGASALGAENAGRTAGLALTVPAAVALGSGALTYGYTRSRQKEELLQKAQQRRRSRQLAAGQIYAYPTHADGSEFTE